MDFNLTEIRVINVAFVKRDSSLIIHIMRDIKSLKKKRIMGLKLQLRMNACNLSFMRLYHWACCLFILLNHCQYQFNCNTRIL